MTSLDLHERTRIAANARQKLEANKAVNHPEAIVKVRYPKWPDGTRKEVVITVYLPLEEAPNES